jgi:pimeloyl-ACP methyl ester carboxylesterase
MTKRDYGFKSPDSARNFITVYDEMLKEWPPHETAQVSTRFGMTHVAISGPLGATPLVLLGGMNAAGAISWFENIGLLSRNNRVYAVDTIGLAGRSIVSDPPQNEDDYSEWLEEVIGSFNISQVGIVGHGHGGWIAACYAIHHPERVTALVLLDPADAFVSVQKSAILKAIIPLFFPTKDNLRQILLGSYEGNRISELWVESVLIGMRQFRPAKRVMATVLSDNQLKKLTCSTLLLIGEHSPYPAHKVVSRAKRLLANVAAEVVPQAGHMLMIEKASVVNQRIESFLKAP